MTSVVVVVIAVSLYPRVTCTTRVEATETTGVLDDPYVLSLLTHLLTLGKDRIGFTIYVKDNNR